MAVCVRVSYIIQSLLSCRHITINTTASTRLNANKIAVKNDSDVDISMFGPELSFSVYKCRFLACLCASQRQQRLRSELTLAVTDGPGETTGPIGTKVYTRMQINLGMDIG